LNEILHFNHNEKSSVLLIFFFNALVYCFLLLKNGISENKQDSKWLAAFVFLGGLYICPFMLGYAGWYSIKSYREFLFFVPFQQLFLIGPVFYFYLESLLSQDFRVTKKEIIHFLPATFYLIYSLVVFVGDKLFLDEFYFYADGRDKDLDFWYQFSGLISMMFYLALSLKHYLEYRKASLQEVSFADEISFKWIQHFTIAFGVILILRVLFFILNPEWGEFGSKYWYYLCFSILLMYISITGYSSTLKVVTTLRPNLLGSNKGNQEKNTDESEDLSVWKHKINTLFESNDIFKNPNLTLTDLAMNLNTNRNIISKVINQEFQMNFNDYVNEKRVESIIKRLKNGEHIKTTLLGIAIDCGFNSKTTFNRAFKKYTGESPKQYISKNQL
jgi:AraC-like DNA-binding protein